MESQPQNIWKVSLKILNSGIILKIFTHEARINSSMYKLNINDVP